MSQTARARGDMDPGLEAPVMWALLPPPGLLAARAPGDMVQIMVRAVRLCSLPAALWVMLR